MKNVYIYVLNTLADWEIGYITAELNSKRFFKKDAEEVIVKTISYSNNPIITMGGLKIIPDAVINDIIINKDSILILPGSNNWNEKENVEIIKTAQKLLLAKGCVCAICGATVALANEGILDNRKHTSNGKGFLEMMSNNYKGSSYYINEMAVKDDNLITASVAGGLLFAKLILNYLDVFKATTLEAWYNLFNTGEANCFFDIMNSLSN